MDPALFFQVLVNAVMLGALYSLLAMGLSLIFSIMRIIQFAHGAVYMLGAFVVFYVYGRADLNYFLALLIAAVVIGIGAMLLERGFFRRVRGQPLASMIVGMGLILTLEGGALIAFGEKDKFVPSPLPGAVEVAGASISQLRLLTLGVSAALILTLFLFLQRVKMGWAMRAVAQNEDAARLQGVSVNRVHLVGFGIGSALAAVAGGFILPISLLNAFIGTDMVIKAFIIIMLGGLGSIPGAVAGAFFLGAVESFGYTYWGSGAGLIGFVAVILLLMFRPTGILGRA